MKEKAKRFFEKAGKFVIRGFALIGVAIKTLLLGSSDNFPYSIKENTTFINTAAKPEKNPFPSHKNKKS